MQCARSVEELVRILRTAGVEARLDGVVYVLREGECIVEVVTPWLLVRRVRGRYIVKPWFEALAEEIERYLIP